MKPFYGNFVVSSANKFRRRTVVCSAKLLVSKETLCKRESEGSREGERERHDILSKIFVSQRLKIRKGPVPCSTKNLVSKKTSDKRGGDYHNFPSECFASQYRIISQRNPSVFQKVSGIEKL